MKIQKQPDYLIFADSAKKGENTEFPDVSRGWGITIEQTASKPPMEWMNGAFNRVDKNMLYLLQQGIPEWSDKVTYPVNAIIKHKGVLYIALAENDNVEPSKNKSKWRQLQADDFNALPARKMNDSELVYNVDVEVNNIKRPKLNNSGLVALSDFISFSSTNQVMKLPDGTIIQYGMTGVLYGNTQTTIVFPMTFPNEIYTVIASRFGSAVGDDKSYIAEKVGQPTLSNFIMYVDAITNTSSLVCRYIAIGR